MDSASPWRRFSRITLPLLMPNLIVVLVLGLIRAVQIFDEVFVLTGGGPGSATTFIVQFIYQTGFAESIHQYGLAAAASLVLALSLLALTLRAAAADAQEPRGRRRTRQCLGSLPSCPAQRGRGRADWTDWVSYAYLAARSRADVRSGALARPVVVQERRPRSTNFRRSSCPTARRPSPSPATRSRCRCSARRCPTARRATWRKCGASASRRRSSTRPRPSRSIKVNIRDTEAGARIRARDVELHRGLRQVLVRHLPLEQRVHHR